MSLNWDSNKCVNPLPANETEASERECLIWGSIALDLGSVTEENVDEWYFRFKFCEQIGRAVTTHPMRRDVIKRWVGLSMNVVTLTRKKWMKKIMDNVERDVRDDIYLENQKVLKSA
jgi:hypothetical protein